MSRILYQVVLAAPLAPNRALATVSLIGLALLAGCSLSGGHKPTAPPVTPPQTGRANLAPLVVAWADGGDLFVWRSSEPAEPGPRRIASGGVVQPFLSPDGTQIATLRGLDGEPLSLWMSDTVGTVERQLVDATALASAGEVRRLGQIVWAPDSAALYFNTLVGSGIDTRAADDLWRVQTQTGTVERLLPDGEGGLIVPAPDGDCLALASAGRYAHNPAQIAFYVPPARQRTVALEFPAPATASERGWYPVLRWAPDSSGLFTAIPPADLIYGAKSDTALWWLPVSGAPIQTGTVEADYFGLPVFSADGAWVAYIQRRTAPDQAKLTLIVAQRDGSGAVVYAEGETGALTLPDWLPDGKRFIYWQGTPGQVWLGGPDTAPTRFLTEHTPVHEIAWVGWKTYVFVSIAGDSFVLGTGLLGPDDPPQVIGTTTAYPWFDAVRP